MKKFNNMFPTQQDYDDLNNYLTDGVFPENIKSRPRYLRKVEGFQKIDDVIKYQPLDLTLVNPADKEDTLAQLIQNDDNAKGKGVYSLFKYIQSKYINITREDVQKAMESNSNYQMGVQTKHRVNKPIISKFPNQLWAIDLIDLQQYESSNYNWRYIMTVVDIFSRKIFLGKLRNKNAVDTSECFSDIVDRAEIAPDYLISDNGTEFKAEFAEYCRDTEIKQRLIRSYSPMANGVCERANKEVRKIIRAFFVRNNNFRWYNLLPTIEENRNSSFISTVKGIPDQIWVANKERLALRNLPPTVIRDNPRLLARVSVVKKALKEIRKFRDQDNYELGEVVRVKMASIFANVRRLVKQGRGKELVITYTPDTFSIRRVIVPKGVLERKRYILLNSDDRPITTKKGNIVQFYASELQKWDLNEDNDAHITMLRALKLNGCERNENDFVYDDTEN